MAVLFIVVPRDRCRGEFGRRVLPHVPSLIVDHLLVDPRNMVLGLERLDEVFSRAYGRPELCVTRADPLRDVRI